jgi:hypothetical protein
MDLIPSEIAHICPPVQSLLPIAITNLIAGAGFMTHREIAKELRLQVVTLLRIERDDIAEKIVLRHPRPHESLTLGRELFEGMEA